MVCLAFWVRDTPTVKILANINMDFIFICFLICYPLWKQKLFFTKVHGVFEILPAMFHTEHLTSRETDRYQSTIEWGQVGIHIFCQAKCV